MQVSRQSWDAGISRGVYPELKRRFLAALEMTGEGLETLALLAKTGVALGG